MGRPVGMPKLVLPVAQPLLYIFWLFLRNSMKRGVNLGSGWLPVLHQIQVKLLGNMEEEMIISVWVS